MTKADYQFTPATATTFAAVVWRRCIVAPTGSPALDVGTTMQPRCLKPQIIAHETM